MLFRDIEIALLPLGKEAIVYITRRPETKEVLNNSEHSSTISSSLLFDVKYVSFRVYGGNESFFVSALRKSLSANKVILTTLELNEF